MCRLFRFTIGLLFLSLFFTPLSSKEASGSETALPPAGLYEIRSVIDNGFVLDAKNCSVSHTVWSSLQLYRSLHVRQQEFYLEGNGAGACQIYCLETGKALTEETAPNDRGPAVLKYDANLRGVSGNGPDLAGCLKDWNPAQAVLSSYFAENPSRSLFQKPSVQRPEPENTRQWVIEPASPKGSFFIRSFSGRYLTLESNRAYNGSRVILAPFTGYRTQKWVLTPRNIYPNGAADTDAQNPYRKDGRNASTHLSIRFRDHFEKIDTETLASWIQITDSHMVAWKKECIEEFLDGMDRKYNTHDRVRAFHTSSGADITLTCGSYGWEFDRAALKQQILDAAALPGGQIVEPVWTHSTGGFIWDETVGNDFGDSYVEVDLLAQHVWLYKDGQAVLDTDCVSGTAGTERETPPGAYAIFYMQSPAVLRGEDYESPVTYWMPFNNGIGLHDADWRGSFGGEIYLYDGSHGCINLPHEAARQIYEAVRVGFPVICHYETSA